MFLCSHVLVFAVYNLLSIPVCLYLFFVESTHSIALFAAACSELEFTVNNCAVRYLRSLELWSVLSNKYHPRWDEKIACRRRLIVEM